MRLYEIENSESQLVSTVVNVLYNLRGQADDEQQAQELSFPAFENIVKNTGFAFFNYDLFKKLYDTNQSVKSLVKDFNQDTIILDTEADAEIDNNMNYDDEGSTDNVKKMAQSALRKRT